ncbi:MAG: transketolase [Chlorobium sp.]|jgi:transketolase|nr:transketolase [Chlorobium sp.]
MTNSIQLAAQFRAKVVEMSHAAGAAHLASSLSCIDIVAVLYHSVLNLDPLKPKWEDRDRFILSKGHAATALYAALAYKGFLTEKDLLSYGHAGSLLEEHPSPKLQGVEAATGSLGHGLPCGCGIALAGQIKGHQYRTFVLMSDGECNEGSVWEGSMFAPANKLGALCAFVDFNKWQATGRSREVLALDPLADKFKAFGWDVHEIDGHDHQQILNAVQGVSTDRQKPTMVVAHTIKGKGISFMEDDNNWHYRIPTLEEVQLAKAELGVV